MGVLGLFGNPKQNVQTPGSRQEVARGFDTGPCQIKNRECLESRSLVIADLEAQCMCIGNDCFEISIGKYGPKMTRNGTGIIGNAQGLRYRTKQGPGSTVWDNDALRMGIPQNDSGSGVKHITNGGKWIHKTGQDKNGKCIEPTTYTTLGCIGVPCDQWPKLKNAFGASFSVCGGAASDSEIVSRFGCPGSVKSCTPSQRLSTMNACSLYNMRKKARGETPGRCILPSENYPTFETGSEDRPPNPRTNPQNERQRGVE